MKIALDAMGSDHAPGVEVAGAIRAARQEEGGLEIVLVGREETLRAELKKHRRLPASISIVNASQTVAMEDKPVEALRRKKDSSIVRLLELIKNGEVMGGVSAGNTGAVVAGARLILGVLPGVDRPAIAALIPAARGNSILIDAGANIDCKPRQLLQFALLGSEFARFILKKDYPAVGLLSTGAESGKGNELTRQAHGLLEKSRLNFIGNVEGRDVYLGQADVVVCDGFVGNIVLKTGEGLAAAIGEILIGEIKRHLLRVIGGILMKPAFVRLKKRGDYSESGGAPLLGINGTCLICHGSSSPKAISNALILAARSVRQEINSRIIDSIASTAEGKEKI